MAKSRIVRHEQRRNLVQFLTALFSNAYIMGFIEGKIYQGGSKALCVPGLNCYACPGALGSCPIGSLQAVLNSGLSRFSFYVGGFLITIGTAFGRLACGWFCPFGWLQDLLYKIPLPKGMSKKRSLKYEKVLSYLRYVVLVVFVILLPMFVVDAFGMGKPFFCAWVCPSGTISGLLLLASNSSLRGAVSWVFAYKSLILLTTVLLSIILWRPFCRYICPLGAIYGLFNPIAIYRFEIDTANCGSCNICQQACKLDIPVYQTPNSPDCIRCGDCIAACTHNAIKSGFFPRIEPAVQIADTEA
ncbi:MAG: 4Fe-4S binding protein [Sphaerochaetaceae bacterium]